MTLQLVYDVNKTKREPKQATPETVERVVDQLMRTASDFLKVVEKLDKNDPDDRIFMQLQAM